MGAARASIVAALKMRRSCAELLASTALVAKGAKVRHLFEEEARKLDAVAKRSDDLRVTLESAAADAAILKLAAQMIEAHDVAESELNKADGHARTFESELKSGKGRTPEQQAQSQTTLASLAGSGASATKLLAPGQDRRAPAQGAHARACGKLAGGPPGQDRASTRGPNARTMGTARQAGAGLPA